MKALDKWAERVYSETDFGRSVATSMAGIVGLGAYLVTSDWVIAAFSSIIIFPIVRLLSASYHERIKKAAQRHEQQQEIGNTYRCLSADEQAVVAAFVSAGGSVLTWGQVNKLNISNAAIESLIQRDLLSTSMTADGMRETFVLSTPLFDIGQKQVVALERS